MIIQEILEHMLIDTGKKRHRRTLCMFAIACAHSAGWSALRTNMRTTMSTLPGDTHEGGPSRELRSHTSAWILPSGGEL